MVVRLADLFLELNNTAGIVIFPSEAVLIVGAGGFTGHFATSAATFVGTTDFVGIARAAGGTPNESFADAFIEIIFAAHISALHVPPLPLGQLLRAGPTGSSPSAKQNHPVFTTVPSLSW
jgi:hypothetical protein